MKLKQINWGIIGCGNVTEVKSGPPLYKLPFSNLVAVMRRDEAKAADYAKRHNVKKWYTNASELINDADVNAIYIATPPNTHAKYAIEAMKAGKPVYVEKPMARTYSECLDMINASNKYNLPLLTAYYRRSLPMFNKVKEIISSGELGEIESVKITLFKEARERNMTQEQMSWHVFPEISGAGHFYDLASHQLDFLDYLFGEIISIKGEATNIANLYPAEDTVSANFKFKSGILGTGSWCFVADKSEVKDEILITGSLGKVIFTCFKYGLIKVQSDNTIREIEFEQPEHTASNHIATVIDELRGLNSCPSNAISAARTSWVMEEIVKSYYQPKH